MSKMIMDLERASHFAKHLYPFCMCLLDSYLISTFQLLNMWLFKDSFTVDKTRELLLNIS